MVGTEGTGRNKEIFGMFGGRKVFIKIGYVVVEFRFGGAIDRCRNFECENS